MADELKLRKQWDRAAHAKKLYENELIQEYFKAVEKGIMDTFVESETDDYEGHRNCKIALTLLDNFKKQFIGTITTGEAAAKQLKIK